MEGERFAPASIDPLLLLDCKLEIVLVDPSLSRAWPFPITVTPLNAEILLRIGSFLAARIRAIASLCLRICTSGSSSSSVVSLSCLFPELAVPSSLRVLASGSTIVTSASSSLIWKSRCFIDILDFAKAGEEAGVPLLMLENLVGVGKACGNACEVFSGDDDPPGLAAIPNEASSVIALSCVSAA
jgi:hypothetical protein